MGLSFGEIVFILVIAFLVLGPDKLPEVGRTLGKTINNLKKTLSDSGMNLKEEVDQIKKETGLSDLSKNIKREEDKFKDELHQLKKNLK